LLAAAFPSSLQLRLERSAVVARHDVQGLSKPIVIVTLSTLR
jgi:hypothetical protein